MAALSALVSEYKRIRCNGPGDWLDYYAQLPTLEATIEHAALAREPEGQKHGHQQRLPNSVLRSASDELLRARDRLGACQRFEELIAVVEDCRVPGFGQLAIYDTAVRIGAWLKVAPTAVYLHAGTRAGARALGLDVERESIPLAELPAPLRRLTADQIETFLCIYKADLAGLSTRPDKKGRRSSCATQQRRRASRC